jgi:hypothetical protein
MLLKSIYLIFLIKSVYGKVSDISTRIEISSRAIASLIDVMKEKYYIELNLVLLGNDKNLELITNKIRSRIAVPIAVYHNKKVTKKTKFFILKEPKSSIFISSNCKIDVNTLNPYVGKDIAYKSSYFLVYCPYDTNENNDINVPSFISDSRLFVMGHMKNGNLALIGNEMVSKNSCVPRTRILNTFVTSKMKWKSTKFIP